MNRSRLEECAKYFNNQLGQDYPCSNQTVICAVITTDRDKALAVMESRGAIVTKRFQHGIEWELNNERWLWMHWNMNIRGYRFYKVLVDENIDEELFFYVQIKDTIIKIL